MSFYRDVLKRAEKEGKINPVLLPWEKRRATEKLDIKRRIRRKEPGRPQLSIEPLALPHEALNDLQRVIENLCSMAAEKKLRVIGIASAVPNQGNSTLAAVFSLMMARRENGYLDPIAAAGIVGLGVRHAGGKRTPSSSSPRRQYETAVAPPDIRHAQ